MEKCTLIYDASCAFCIRWISLIQRLDTRDTFVAIPNTTPDLARQFPQVADKDVTQSIWLIDEHGNAFAAADATYQIAVRLKWVKVFAVLWHIPPLRSLANWLYKVIAANRHRL